MKNKEKYYINNVFYKMEQAVVYLKLKSAQIFNQFGLGVTVDQYIVLESIYCNNDICQRDLSKLILKDRSNTGRILNILEEKGFINRLIGTKGKRLVRKIYISDKGKVLIETNQTKLTNAYRKIFEEIKEVEFAALSKTLDKIKSSLSATTNIHI